MSISSGMGPSSLPRHASWTEGGDIHDKRSHEILTPEEYFAREQRLEEARRSLGLDSKRGRGTSKEEKARQIWDIMCKMRICRTLFVDSEPHGHSWESWACRILKILIKVGIIEGYHPDQAPYYNTVEIVVDRHDALVDRIRPLTDADGRFDFERLNNGYEIPDYKKQCVKLALAVALIATWCIAMRYEMLKFKL